MSLLFGGKEIKNDVELEASGVWVEVDVSSQEVVESFDAKPKELEEGFLYLRVARYGNAKAQKRTQALAKKYNLNKPQHKRKYMAELLAETVLLEWANVKDESGAEIEYTAEQGRALMEDDEYEWLANIVAGVSRDVQNFRRENITIVGKK